MNWNVIRIVLSILGLAPIRSAKDWDFKWELATAISDATDEPMEQDILVRIAYFESGFRRSVARCTVKGDKGKSLGIFQIQPQSKHDLSKACGTIADQTELALVYVHRSFAACPGNVGADLLAMYVSGTCQRGLKQAKHRWGAE